MYSQNYEIVKQKIMRRVFIIFWMRRLLSAQALRFYGVIGAFWLGMLYVSPTYVAVNMPSLLDMPSVVAFFSHAVLHTERIVQVTLLLIAFLSAWILRDMLRRMPRFERSSHAVAS